jgi:hypothetical protein
MNTKKTQLEIKVLAINLFNEFATIAVAYENEHFKQFLGKDIFKVDGSVKQKYQHEPQTFKGTLKDGTHYNFHYWFSPSKSSFNMTMKICINGGSYDLHPSNAFCLYHETTTELFAKENGVLIESTRQRHDFTKRFSVDELLKANEAVKQAEEAFNEAKKSVPYDFHSVLNIGYIR